MLRPKLLMHIAVEQGAAEGKSFLEYVDYLVDKNIVAAPMRVWVDEIRQLGNGLNHEIDPMSDTRGRELMGDAAARGLRVPRTRAPGDNRQIGVGC